MIFAVHNLWINTKKQSVTELSSWTEIREFERPESVENFFQFIADKMAEEWCGSRKDLITFEKKYPKALSTDNANDIAASLSAKRDKG